MSAIVALELGDRWVPTRVATVDHWRRAVDLAERRLRRCREGSKAHWYWSTVLAEGRQRLGDA